MLHPNLQSSLSSAGTTDCWSTKSCKQLINTLFILIMRCTVRRKQCNKHSLTKFSLMWAENIKSSWSWFYDSLINSHCDSLQDSILIMFSLCPHCVCPLAGQCDKWNQLEGSIPGIPLCLGWCLCSSGLPHRDGWSHECAPASDPNPEDRHAGNDWIIKQ